MARLGIEPRLPEYIPGALPLSYLAMVDQVGSCLVWIVQVENLQCFWMMWDFPVPDEFTKVEYGTIDGIVI